MFRWLSLFVCLFPSVALAQDMRLLDCYDVSPFGAGCASVVAPEPVWEPVAVPPAPPQPLFSKETMAPTTPQVVIDYMNTGTVEKADAVLRFEMDRWEITKQRTRLLKERAALLKGAR